jgi:hypothetical protein
VRSFLAQARPQKQSTLLEMADLRRARFQAVQNRLELAFEILGAAVILFAPGDILTCRTKFFLEQASPFGLTFSFRKAHT